MRAADGVILLLGSRLTADHFHLTPPELKNHSLVFWFTP